MIQTQHHISNRKFRVIVKAPLRPARCRKCAASTPSPAIGLGSVPPATHIRSAPLQPQYTGNPHWPGLRPPQRGEQKRDHRTTPEIQNRLI